jgi:hypothetical protein
MGHQESTVYDEMQSEYEDILYYDASTPAVRLKP